MATAKTALKIKKKKWVQIVDSGMFGSKVVGETYVEDTKLVLGKTITVNMIDITNDPKRQSINVMLQVSAIKEDKGVADVIGFGLNTSSVKRMMRRGKQRVDMSEIHTTKDLKRVKIKPFMVSRVATYNSTLTSIRHATHKFLVETFKKSTYEDILSQLLSGKIQRTLGDMLDKIVPLSSCEIRELRLLSKEGIEKVEKKEAVETSPEIKEAPSPETQELKEEPQAPAEEEQKVEAV